MKDARANFGMSANSEIFIICENFIESELAEKSRVAASQALSIAKSHFFY